MGNRLSKIYTRTGDDGTTGLGDGQRVPKDSARVEAYGAVDELNSTIGVLLAVRELPQAACSTASPRFSTSSSTWAESCASRAAQAIKAEQVARLEQELDAFNEPLPPLKDFILPGGGPMAAACHVARTVARRAERRVWTLGKLETVNSEASRYLNRLSDLLFVIARVLARHEHGSEVLWRHERQRRRPE